MTSETTQTIQAAQPLSPQNLISKLRSIVGHGHVLTDPEATWRYRRGYRYGEGAANAVVRPTSLVQLWRVAKACAEAGCAVIMQASNTGLTGGSTPDGDDYGRPLVIISTRELKGIHLIGDGRQAVCLPGADLYELEKQLRAIGREPHSVIGSSCIGASVLGGISNNSGGALVHRGPAYTEMALFGRVNAQGQLELVNHLGISLPGEPEAILRAVEKGQFDPQSIDWNAGAGHDTRYIERVRDVDAETPARFNALSSEWHEAAGCAGKLVVFAVRVDTFPAEKGSQVFYVGCNSVEALEEARRGLLTQFSDIPIAGEYMSQDIFRLTDRYGRDTMAIIKYLGTGFLPSMFALKARVDAFARDSSWLPTNLTDRIMQVVATLLPSQLPKRLRAFAAPYKHHLVLRLPGAMAAEAGPWLKRFFADPAHEGAVLACSEEEGKQAFLFRFAAAGTASRYAALYPNKVGGLLTLDVALRRNERNWEDRVPPEAADKMFHKLYFGHFMCHVMHQVYVLKKGVDDHALQEVLLKGMDERGARYPAEHNFGHHYHAPDDLVAHYKDLDPCNQMNPGIGQATKKPHWRG
ncbi:D-lactate dehydrogenase [Formicincola oecophyllae]|uniref:Quinone-dependent D-lactate dehydrogenase n=1 Tax=Formicincola oecophyllae TaxID=2558361 RepID=A0A4Y6U8B9_9PROT|nr:D-lactate dehydrogenase [Formicincola oecophyllae]QDH13424.1 D-lactate dehydrogenase [Formicincola oecophyllae]